MYAPFLGSSGLSRRSAVTDCSNLPLRSTTSLVLLMYEEGFRWWRMGYAAAVAVVLFLVILAFTLVQRRLQRESIA